MEAHFKLSDQEFEEQFISCKLKSSDFTHLAHLRLAWITLKKHSIVQAELNIQKHLKNFVKFVGAKEKYNKTLTVAATRIVYHFMLKSNSSNFQDFINEFPRLKTKFKTLIDTHYSFDIYNSQRAKTEFLFPDLVPFE